MSISGAFLQSRGWEAFQKLLGKEVRRLDGSLVIKHDIGLGMHYWYCPRGPLPTTLPSEAIFFRYDAPEEITNYPITKLPNFRPAPHDVQPSTTIILDLTKTEEQLLSEMHPKTRYNIKVAERHGVTVEIGGSELLETFFSLLQSTTERNIFRAHAKSYYQKMLKQTPSPSDSPSGRGSVEAKFFLALARVDNKPSAIALMVDFNDTRTYLHGASDYTLRESMAPFALHWYLINDAKKRGLTAYDFWGIATTDNPKEPLAGVTRFKKGWGGDIVRYPQTMDLVMRPVKYAFYRLVHRLITRR